MDDLNFCFTKWDKRKEEWQTEKDKFTLLLSSKYSSTEKGASSESQDSMRLIKKWA